MEVRGKMKRKTHIRKDAVRDPVFLGAHALLDERVPHFDILGVPRSALERGDGEVHFATVAERNETLGEIIGVQMRAQGFSFL